MLSFSAGVVLMIFLAATYCEEVIENSTDIHNSDDDIHYNERKIESGIVFKDRGYVLITGESWTVAKEFNITEISSIVKEAKKVFPDIKKRLEKEKQVKDGHIWDLDFFHDTISYEIDVIEPIINQIEKKIKIFENMLPRGEIDTSKPPIRNKRFLAGLGKFLKEVAIGIGAEFIVKLLFSSNDDHELRHLNAKFERMKEYQMFMMQVQNLHGVAINTLDWRVDKNAEAIKILENKYKMNISELDMKIDENAEEIKIIEGLLNEQFTIMTDLEIRTRENQESIKSIAFSLEKVINDWELSQKKQAEKLTLVINVTSTMRMMEMRLLNIDTYLTGLLEALDTTATGRLSANLISPSELVEILRDISRKLPEGVYPLTLIEEDAVYEYYTYASVGALAVPNAIRVFIKLPLKSANHIFHLLEPYSLPFYHKDARVFLEISEPSEYILASKDRQKVAEISGRVLKECKKKDNFYLCPTSFPLYEGTKCSLSLIKGDDEEIIKTCKRKVVVPDFQSRWIRTFGGWIYSVSSSIRLMRVSENNPPELVRVNGTGFLRDIPHAYSYSSDGTVLFPSDDLGDDTLHLSTDDVLIPRVPNLLLLNESSHIQQENVLKMIEKLSKSSSDQEKVNLDQLLSYVKPAKLTSEEKYISSNYAIPVLAIAVIIMYAIMGIMCWNGTKRNIRQTGP